jgi:hypothetical protein
MEWKQNQTAPLAAWHHSHQFTVIRAVKTREMSAKSHGTSKVCYTNCGQLMIPILVEDSALMKWPCSHCDIVVLWYCHFRVHVFNPSDYHKVSVSTIMQFITGAGMLIRQTIRTQRTTDHYRSVFKTVGRPPGQFSTVPFCSVLLPCTISCTQTDINNKTLLKSIISTDNTEI